MGQLNLKNLKYRLTMVWILCLTSCSTWFKSEEIPKSAQQSQIRMQIGLNYLQDQNYPLALKEFLAAEELEPENPYIQNNLGLVYFIREKYDLSIKHFGKAYELDKSYTEAKNNLARVYIEIKQFSIAKKLLNEVISDLTYTGLSKAYMNYGLLEFNRNRFKDSKFYFKKVLETNREDCFANVYLGRSYLELKENKSAFDQLDKATLFCAPYGVDEAHYYSAIALYRLRQPENSLIRFKEILSQFSNGKFREQSKKMISLIEKGLL